MKELEHLTEYNSNKVKRWLKSLQDQELINIKGIGKNNIRIYNLTLKGQQAAKKIAAEYKNYFKEGYKAFKKYINNTMKKLKK